MDNKTHQSDIIKHILKEGNYYISVSGQLPGEVDVFTSMDDAAHKFSWDDGVATIDNTKYPCPDYAVPANFDAFLTSLCDRYKFHKPYVKFDTEISFPKPSKLENLQQFDYLYKDIERNGLKPHHIALARESKLSSGLKSLLKIHYDISIKD